MKAKMVTALAATVWLCLGTTIQGHEMDAKNVVSSQNTPETSRHKIRDYPVRPVPFTDVKVTDDFWAPRIETNRKVTIPHAFKKCEETGRIDNFATAGGLMEGKHRGNFPFDDTDPYKILEGAAYSLSVHPDAKQDKYLDDLIVKIAAAQEDDGYLYTARTNNSERLRSWFGDQRWERLARSHELYNMGHLYEAAVAHYQATGKHSLLNVATKNAELIDTVFGPGKNEDWPGHQVIEMGLVKLYRVTDNKKYLDLAKFFLDTRGPGGGRYNQSHKKPVEQTEAVGHAVRATYMYCGMADIAALTDDQRYFNAIKHIWDNVVQKKLYITGGVGATGGAEAFGRDYQLPNATAYCETCAAIGNVMWNHRMFLLTGESKYIDVLERTLYNGLISGVSLEGNSFFYPNPLESRGDDKRSGWFSCACCPGNITRFIASVAGYVYGQSRDNIYVNLFVAGEGQFDIGGNPVRIIQQTQYPWQGYVKMMIQPDRPGRFGIYIRIPGWAQGQPVSSDLYSYLGDIKSQVSLRVNGNAVPVETEKGYVRIERKWNNGDVIELDLPMQVRRVLANEKVKADVGRVALERGPIVYCAEWPDNGGHVLNLVLPDDTELKSEHREELLGGITIIHGRALALSSKQDINLVERKWQDFMAIPYYAWAHRGPGEMAVWLARDESVAQTLTPLAMIHNPSFEKGDNNKPADWQEQIYGGEGEFKYVEGGHTGKRCVIIASENGGDLGWLTSVAVKPHSQYILSGWIKTENVVAGSGKGALLNLHNIQPLQTPAVTGTEDWTRVELIFDSADNTVVQINCLFGGWGLSTGKAWFDDLNLELLSARDNQR